MGVFDLEKPMFLMESISCVLDNACKAGLMYVKYDDIRVDTDMTRRNMQCYITCTNESQKGGSILRQRRSIWGFLVRGLLHI